MLVYATDAQGESYVAVDQGVLVKSGLDVLVSVRRALAGADLGRLHETVQHEFLTVDQEEQNVRAVMTKLESGLLHRLARFQHE